MNKTHCTGDAEHDDVLYTVVGNLSYWASAQFIHPHGRRRDRKENRKLKEDRKDEDDLK